jgi:hypothetical protein
LTERGPHQRASLSPFRNASSANPSPATTTFALLDGPIVLAALGTDKPAILRDSTITSRDEHQYVEARDSQTSHFSLRTPRRTVALKPLYEIADETYCVTSTLLNELSLMNHGLHR